MIGLQRGYPVGGMAMRRIAVCLLAVLVCSAALARTAQMEPPRRDIADCRFASVDAAHHFVVAGVMNGDTLTNLQLGDPNGKSTAIRVEVKPGAGPLTVFLHSQDAVIWDFEGAVEEIGSVFIVARSGNRRVAARGLPEGIARFPDLSRCPPVIDAPTMRPLQDRNNIELYFGRPADSVAFQAFPHTLLLPADEFALTPRRTDRMTPTESDLFMYHRGGFRRIDPKSVLSPESVLEPETYPIEAGLDQLARDGAIRPPTRSDKQRLIEGFRRKYPSRTELIERTGFGIDYVITREVMLPPGLFGAHLKMFLVPAGVPEPRGNAGHGCVIFEDGHRGAGPTCGGILRECSPWESANAQSRASCRLPGDGNNG